jgi:hypothetical protein
MSSTIRQTVTVQPGGVVEIRSPELREGDQAEVTVVVKQPANGGTHHSQNGGWRRYAWAVNRKDGHAADNQRIDTDLANEYGRKSDAER